MNREDIIRMARDLHVNCEYTEFGWQPVDRYEFNLEELEKFAALVAAAEREAWPRLDPVIAWLENGCDPAEAAKELRIYAAAIRARGEK